MEPEELRFTKSHEWIAVDGSEATVGITDHAQSEMNDIIYVELPDVGSSIGKGDVLAVLESVKAAEEVYSPIAGEVVAVNTELDSQPERINEDPFGDGWLARVRIEGTDEIETLMDHDAYRNVLEGE